MKVIFKRSFSSIWNAVEHLCNLSWSFKETVSWESKGMILPNTLITLQKAFETNVNLANEEHMPVYEFISNEDENSVTLRYCTASGKNEYLFKINRENMHVDVTWVTYSHNYTCIFQAINLEGWDIETDDVIKFNSKLFSEDELTKMGKIMMLVNRIVDSKVMLGAGVYRELIYLYEKKELDIRISCTESGYDIEPYFAMDIEENMSLNNVFEFIEDCLTEEVTVIKRKKRNSRPN